ncbi:MAG: hypothetical protein WDW36_000172 [Sanguina aurantia]
MGTSKAKSHQTGAHQHAGRQGDATDLAQEAQARQRSAAINEAHERERRNMHKNGMFEGVHEVLSSKLTKRTHAIFKHRLDKLCKRLEAAHRAGEPFQPPALFQVANLPESMTDPAGRRTEGWVESSLQKIERQLTGMVLDAFAAEHDAYRPALGTPQGFLTLLRDLPPRVGVNRKLREYVVRADNDSLERVGLYLSKG